VVPKLLIVASEGIRRELGGTVLFRSGVERLFAANAEAAFQVALTARPSLVLVDADHQPEAAALIRRLRENPQTRRCSVVALKRSGSPPEDEELRRAGANEVLSAPVDPSRWNPRLERLLAVPPRREARFPVRFEFWSGVVAAAEPIDGVALNISVNGLLLETEEPLDMGTRLDLGFLLPYQHDALRALGHVVREARGEDRPRSGIEFLILHGEARARIGAFVAAG
jgi:CheY-like chemotaxis protein